VVYYTRMVDNHDDDYDDDDCGAVDGLNDLQGKPK
jgi:hypothetical protein